MIGRELDGRYRILSKLGEGAMGEVYRVEHMQLRRIEALKVLRPSFNTSGDVVSRFRREARATNRLQHPNIISVYDFGRLPDGRFYLTTEFADGETLHAHLQRVGRLPVPRALFLLSQLADAVEHAHSRGVIHRDLKPQNLVLIERRGDRDMLKVLDFGVSKIIAPDYQDSVAATRKGQVFGTPAYLSPEQIRGQGDDPRIDIYAIGCIAVELLCGMPPFGGRTMDIVGAHLQLPPPRILDQLHDAPAELDALVQHCLEKDADQRFQTAGELSAALTEVPGYPVDRLSTDRRSYQSVPESVLARVRRRSAIETAETYHGNVEQVEATLIDGLNGADVVRYAIDRALVAHQQKLRQVAEALIDRGSHDFKLTLDVANLAALEGQLGRLAGEERELEQHEDEIEQRRRVHESSLRFAIGELRFECHQAQRDHRPIDDDIEHQLSQLELSLANLASANAEELDALTERGIAIAAERAVKGEELAAMYNAIEQRLGEAIASVESDPQLDALHAQLDTARAQLEAVVSLRES